ncbi:hypothetical protein ACVWY3_004696 [Bradyrhizobium sp. USDA 4486]
MCPGAGIDANGQARRLHADGPQRPPSVHAVRLPSGHNDGDTARLALHGMAELCRLD